MSINNFADVCATANRAKSIEADAEKVLDALLQSNERMQAKDIAIKCGWVYAGGISSNYQRVTHALKFLIALGLAKRIIVEGIPIEIENDEWINDEDGQPNTITVNGVTYRREIAWGRRGHWGKVKKTVIPKTPYFELVK